MKKITCALVAITMLVIAACSKDQKVVKELEGTWKVTAVKEDGVAQPDSTFNTQTYSFEKCKVKKGPCNGTMTDEGKALPFTYSISEKGTRITMTVFGISEVGEILEHSESKFVFRSMDGSPVTETTLTKQ
jgi:hypothetical protein